MKVTIWVGNECLETDTESPVPVTELNAMRQRQTCIYCGSTEDLEVVSGDGGYGQPKAYACKRPDTCLQNQVKNRVKESKKCI